MASLKYEAWLIFGRLTQFNWKDYVGPSTNTRKVEREMRAIEHSRNKGNICRIYFIYLIQRCGSGAFLTSGSGMEKKSRSGFITDLISDNLVCMIEKKKFQFVKFVATKKGLTTNFFEPLSFVFFGSGIRNG